MAVLGTARVELVGNLDRLRPVDVRVAADARLVAVAGRIEVKADLGIDGTEVELQLATLVEAEPVSDTDGFSGGRIGCQICLSPDDFCRAAGAEYADLIQES